jgi:hypothetical protein
MCAFKARDGRQFTNASQMNIHNRKLQPAPTTPLEGVKIQGKAVGDGRQPIPQSKFSKPESPRKASLVDSKPKPDTDDDTQDYSQSVNEHGPALRVDIKHGDNGSHTVDAVMGDSTKHHSDHTSAEEAHAAARQLSGLDTNSDDDQELPDLSKVM